ncbi:NAD(P)H-dependent flavin oxidoreductase [Psychromicrobium xiongbiense]|uniref:NAD(P)H-dependent flavin oxidoreductase n=1 Tax=Psychromicrobium xiongbiense TaxID=3051184 RepID=UPI002557278E|nr:nitronate monooxygenase [Psychromicrobium sp. YIM S02556]
MFSSSLIVAPMAGGPSTPELVTAAAQAGALGFLAAGYLSAQALKAQLEQVRDAGVDYGVNLFVPTEYAPADLATDRAMILQYRNTLEAEALRYGIDLPEVPGPEAHDFWQDDDGWQEKLDLLLAQPAPWLSFTFGLPGRAEIDALHRAGSRLLATVTTVEEASAAQDRGVDALVVQHSSAGGHSGAFLSPETLGPADLPSLVQALRRTSPLPLVAAGSISNRTAVDAALQAGADAVQCGTAFLLAEEAGTRRLHRAALESGHFHTTARTRAFTGRWARGLENRFIREHPDAPRGYPQIHRITAPLRAAAAQAGDAEAMSLWAGSGFGEVSSGSTAQIVGRLLG